MKGINKKNTKNWYTIDALGAIFVILTMLTLAMWTLLTILTLNWSNPTLTAFPIWIQLYLNLTRHTSWNQPLKYPPSPPCFCMIQTFVAQAFCLHVCILFHVGMCFAIFASFCASFLFLHLYLYVHLF